MNSKFSDPDLDSLFEYWNGELNTTEARFESTNAIGRAYDGAITRDIRLEAKAIGFLQMIAIGIAVITFVSTRDAFVLKVLSLISLTFFGAAIWGTLEVLKVRSRPQLLVQDSLSSSHGLVETAVSANGLQMLGTKTSNFMWGVTRDLTVGSAVASIALVLMVFGIGSAQKAPAPSSSIPANSMPNQSIVVDSVP